MDLPIVDFFESWFSKKSHTTNLFVALIVGGIVLLLLATLLSVALASPDDLFDQDDLSFFESSALVWPARHGLVLFLFLGLTIRVLFAIMRLEFVTGHIGEKRPSDQRIEFAVPSRFFRTTRFPLGSVVLFVSPVCLFDVVITLCLVFVRARFTRSRARNVFIHFERITRRFMVMRRMNQLSLSNERILIQGGL